MKNDVVILTLLACWNPSSVISHAVKLLCLCKKYALCMLDDFKKLKCLGFSKEFEGWYAMWADELIILII